MFKVKNRAEFDFDFNILTAFIRLGRARPVGAGCPPYYYYLTLTVAAECIFTLKGERENG